MIAKIKYALLTLTSLVLMISVSSVLMTATASAGTTDQFCQGIKLTDSAGCGGKNGGTESCAGSTVNGNCDQDTTIENTLKAIVNILSLIVGVVAVIMVLIAGFRFMTSGGESQKAASARNALLYAIIGIVIVALAQIIVRFVVNRALGATSGK